MKSFFHKIQIIVRIYVSVSPAEAVSPIFLTAFGGQNDQNHRNFKNFSGLRPLAAVTIFWLTAISISLTGQAVRLAVNAHYGCN